MWEKFRGYMLRNKQYSYDVALLLTRYKVFFAVDKVGILFIKNPHNLGNINLEKSAVIHSLVI